MRLNPFRRGGGSDTPTVPEDEFGATQLTADDIAAIREARVGRRGIQVRPYKRGGGLETAEELYEAFHDTRYNKPVHSFEMRYVDELAGFQYVPGHDRLVGRFEQQLENYYPDSNIEPTETDAIFLPEKRGWHVAAANLSLKRVENGEYLYPVRSHRVEGFNTDPYGSITSSMVGDWESEHQTDVLVQITFMPADEDWHDGPRGGMSVHDLAEDLKQPKIEYSWKQSVKNALFANADEEPRTIEPSDSEKKAAKLLKQQDGQRGFHMNVRIIAVSEDETMAVRRVSETAGMFRSYYNSDTKQGFSPNALKSEDDIREMLLAAERREMEENQMVMGIPWFAAAAHVPNETINTQNVDWSLTSDAGNVPSSADRFEKWNRTNWTEDTRTADISPGSWAFAIPVEKQPEDEIAPDHDEEDDQTPDITPPSMEA